MGQHLMPQLEQVIALIEQARSEGVRITADMYPYTATATGFDVAMPGWVQEGGIDKWVERLKDPATRAAAPTLAANGATSRSTCRRSARSMPTSRSMPAASRSEEHTSELQSLMRISYAVFCLKKKQQNTRQKIEQ